VEILVKGDKVEMQQEHKEKKMSQAVGESSAKNTLRRTNFPSPYASRSQLSLLRSEMPP